MDRLFSQIGHSSLIVTDRSEQVRIANEILGPLGFSYDQQVQVRGFYGRIIGAEREYIAPWENRDAQIAVLVAIPDDEGSGVHRKYLLSEVRGWTAIRPSPPSSVP